MHADGLSAKDEALCQPPERARSLSLPLLPLSPFPAHHQALCVSFAVKAVSWTLEGFPPFVSLSGMSLMLPAIQCLETIVSCILSSFLVV